jgi:hypothetical protein
VTAQAPHPFCVAFDEAQAIITGAFTKQSSSNTTQRAAAALCMPLLHVLID